MNVAAKNELSLLAFDIPASAGLRGMGKWPRFFSVSVGNQGEVERCEEVGDPGHYHGFIHFDRSLGYCALYAVQDRVYLSIGSRVFAFGNDRSTTRASLVDWFVVRRFSISDGERVVFCTTYFPSLIKTMLGDAMTSEFHDFFRYVAQDFQQGFSNLKQVVSRTSRA